MRIIAIIASCAFLLSGCMIVRKPNQQELAALDSPPPEILAKLDIFLPRVETWYTEVENQLAPKGRPLTSDEAQAASELGVAEPAKVRVVVLEEFPMPKDEMLLAEAKYYGLGSWAEGGRCKGYVILLKPRAVSHPAVLWHELVHIAQQDRMGRRAFLRRYLTELQMMGYARSPLELEAYAKQGSVK